MTTKDAQEKRKQLEQDIINVIDRFERETSLLIKDVHLEHARRIDGFQKTISVAVECHLQ